MASTFLVKFQMRQRRSSRDGDASAVAQGLHCATAVQFCATGKLLVQLRANHQFFCATLPGQNGFLGEAKIVLSTLPPWLNGIINARVAEATQHPQTAPTLKELLDFLEQLLHEYDP